MLCCLEAVGLCLKCGNICYLHCRAMRCLPKVLKTHYYSVDILMLVCMVNVSKFMIEKVMMIMKLNDNTR